MLTDRVRSHLIDVAKLGQPVTYQAVAKALELSPPNTIQQVTVALEQLMEEDVTAGSPMIAALVIGKGTAGLPRPGFFECAKRLARFHGDASGEDAAIFHKAELERAVAFWSLV